MPTDCELLGVVDTRERTRALSWLASLALAAGELRTAEGCLLELLALCAFVVDEEAVRS